ncbi:MAG: YfhO family protein, partial [Chloroflexota bacterium]|nr:YfhO family protein [Chloroflexota bacterium]
VPGLAVEIPVTPAPLTHTVTLRAGVETAEWAYGRPDVRAQVRHAPAPVALEIRLAGAVSGSFTVFEYLATVDLTAFAELREVRARAVIPGAGAYIQGLFLEPVPDDRFTPARPTDVVAGPGVAGTFNRHARPRVSLAAAGGAPSLTWLDDGPERVSVRVQAPRADTLVLADSFYPGWIATVDGVAVPIKAVEGLFRGVDIAAGEHEVVFVYRPTSLWIGAALTVVGLLLTVGLAIVSVLAPRSVSLSGTVASQAVARRAPPPASRTATTTTPSGPRA